MKKTLIFIMAAALVMGLLSGCAKVTEKYKPQPTETSDIGTPDETPSSEPTATSTPAPTPEPVDVSLAVWDGNVFISEWADIRIEIPNGWTKLSDEELSQLYSASAEVVAGAIDLEIKELDNLNFMYPLMILKYPMGTNLDKVNTNLSVFFEKLLPPNNLLVNAKGYLETTKTQYEDMNMGYEVKGDIELVKVNGQKFYSINVLNETMGIRQVFLCRKKGGFIIGIVITSGIEGQQEIDELIGEIERN